MFKEMGDVIVFVIKFLIETFLVLIIIGSVLYIPIVEFDSYITRKKEIKICINNCKNNTCIEKCKINN